jgi:hypothetical protein
VRSSFSDTYAHPRPNVPDSTSLVIIFDAGELEHFGCCMALSRVRIQSIGDAEVLLTARSQHQSTTWRRQEIAKRSLSKSHSVKRVVLKIEDVAAA